MSRSALRQYGRNYNDWKVDHDSGADATWSGTDSFLYGKLDPLIDSSLTTKRRILGANASGTFRTWLQEDPESWQGTSSREFAKTGDVARFNELGIRYVRKWKYLPWSQEQILLFKCMELYALYTEHAKGKC